MSFYEDVLVPLTLTFWAIGSWLTHVFVSFEAGKYILLVLGVILPPVGMVHGTGVWFGAW